MKLNIGCGQDIRAGYINCDIVKVAGVDKVVDVTKPLPFKDNFADEILCKYVLEHLVISPLAVLKEFHRVLKPNGLLEVHVPYCKHSTAFAADHIRYFDNYSFDGIEPDSRKNQHMFGKERFEFTWKTSNKYLNSIKDFKFLKIDFGSRLMRHVYFPFLSNAFPFEIIIFKFKAIK